MSFGYSASDFYLLVQLVGSVIESFGNGPRGATQQYSNLKAEIGLISKQLDELPEKGSSFATLWESTKAQCADFVIKYSNLAPADSKVAVDKEAKWKWLLAQGEKIFAKVKWPLKAREEAMELQRNVLHLIQIATLDVSSRHYKVDQQNYETLEALLQQVLQQCAEESKGIDDKIEHILDGVKSV